MAVRNIVNQSYFNSHNAGVTAGRQAVGFGVVQINDQGQRRRRCQLSAQEAKPARLDQVWKIWRGGDARRTRTPFGRADHALIVGNQARAQRHQLQRQRRFSGTRCAQNQDGLPVGRDGAGMHGACAQTEGVRLRRGCRQRTARPKVPRSDRHRWDGCFRPRSRRHAPRRSVSRSPAQGRNCCRTAVRGARRRSG